MAEETRFLGILKGRYELATTIIAAGGLLRGFFSAYSNATVAQWEPLITITLSLGLLVVLFGRRVRALEAQLASEPNLELFFDPASPDCVRIDGIWTRYYVGIRNSGGLRAKDVSCRLVREAGLTEVGDRPDSFAGLNLTGGTSLDIPPNSTAWVKFLSYKWLGPAETDDKVYLHFEDRGTLMTWVPNADMEIGLNADQHADPLRLRCSMTCGKRPTITLVPVGQPWLTAASPADVPAAIVAAQRAGRDRG